MKILETLRKILLIYFIAVIALSGIYLLLPPISTLMIGRLLTFDGYSRDSVSLKYVSPQLIRAVIRAEDSKFCQHWGVDWDSMEDAVGKRGGPSRGASTISMQVVKNLFLWPQRSYLRKALEIPMALYLDLIWPKKRMMEVYLSVAEWGDGIFGVEAAAQHYFGKPARLLSSRESALLAAMLPNPLKRNPARPSQSYAKHAQNIQKWANSGVDTSCLR